MNMLKFKGFNVWIEEEIVFFYCGFVMFGIDFEIILKMILGK